MHVSIYRVKFSFQRTPTQITSTTESVSQSANQLFNALKLDPNIPIKFMDTNRHLPWIKAVKERHGSVETSSLQQVETINQTGIYKIGNWDSPKEKSLTLKFQEIEGLNKGNKEYVKEWNHAELNELRSKLMLISKSSDATVAVDKFVKIDALD